MKQQPFDFSFFFFFFFFLEFARKSVLLLKFYFVRWAKYKTSILLILLKCIVVGHSNVNESLTARLFSNYGLMNISFHFFRYLTYSVFHVTFVKRFKKKMSFFSSNLKNQFQDIIYFRKLGYLTLWYWNDGPLNVK